MPKIPTRTNESNGKPRLRPLAARIRAFESLRVLFYPVDKEWIKSYSRASRNGHTTGGLTCKPCDSYRGLVSAWEKAVRWTDGLDHGLASMLASIASVKSVGDQLWLKVLGPASCGKSILCEALSVNTKHVLAKSTLRGFNSGFTKTGEEGEDNSLIAELFDKTLVIKDGDTLLKAPNLSQILSEMRDAYDGANRPSYRNQMSKVYLGLRITVLLCGTSSLKKIDSSELGERFLDCVIMDVIDTKLEDEILWRVVNRANKNVDLETSTDLETHDEPNMANAKQLTGGYVDYLRDNAAEELPLVSFSEEYLMQCLNLGKFVSYMRARPSYLQEELAEREFGARLASQLVRLAKCLAFVLNKRGVDIVVMGRVKRIAFDTSRGDPLTITNQLGAEEGLQVGTIATNLSKTPERTKKMLQFMRRIGITETFKTSTKGVRSQVKWRLTGEVQSLYETISDYGSNDDA